DILGDAVVLAYSPGPPAKPEDERGVILLRARDPQLLAGLIDRLNKMQQKQGDLRELVPIEHRSSTYFRRVEKRKTNYYLLRDKLLVLSAQEDILRGVIDRLGTSDERKSGPVAQLRSAGAFQT